MRKILIAATCVAALGFGLPASAGSHGKDIFGKVCFACHQTGAAGAPMLGDKAAWAPRIAQGMETLNQHAINGLNAMPPMGTCAACSEADIAAATEYMVNEAK